MPQGRKNDQDTQDSQTASNLNIDTEQIYKVVQEAFADLNTSYSSIRQSALDMIASRPFYALASAAVIGLAAGVAFRNQIVAAKNELASKTQH